MAPVRTDKIDSTSVYLYKKSLQYNNKDPLNDIKNHNYRGYRQLSRREDSLNSIEFPLDDSNLQAQSSKFIYLFLSIRCGGLCWWW